MREGTRINSADQTVLPVRRSSIGGFHLQVKVYRNNIITFLDYYAILVSLHKNKNDV